jgi:hypothetical protein
LKECTNVCSHVSLLYYYYYVYYLLPVVVDIYDFYLYNNTRRP